MLRYEMDNGSEESHPLHGARLRGDLSLILVSLVNVSPFTSFKFPLKFRTIPLVTAAQLLVSLFVYDTLLTLVLSAYCGLCVEVATTHTDRVRVTIFGELFGLIGKQ